MCYFLGKNPVDLKSKSNRWDNILRERRACVLVIDSVS